MTLRLAIRHAVRRVAKIMILLLPVLQLARHLPSRRARALLLIAADKKLIWRPRSYSNVKTVYGFRIHGNTADHIQRRIFIFRVWEPNLSTWISSHLRPGDVALDVGSNIGYFSLLAASRVGPEGRVIAFEPVPTIVERLRANIAANGFDNVEVIPVALSETNRVVEMYRGTSSNLGQSSTTKHAGFISEGNVNAYRGADCVSSNLWHAVRLIKIDVEGDEFSAMIGLRPVLAEMHEGSAVIAELTPEWLEARGQSLPQALNFMESLGFEAFTLDETSSPIHYALFRATNPIPLRHVPTAQTDILFVKTRGAEVTHTVAHQL